MKKLIPLLLALLIAASWVWPAAAEDGTVTYSGNAGSFVFLPGSEASPTDLFPNFKDVMPGDVLTQNITLKNNADNQVVVKFWLRSIAPVEDVDFLSQLQLQVTASVKGQQTWLFDGPSVAASLDSPVWLGTLYNGGQVDLTVSLTVPTSTGNDYQDRLGKIDWVFYVEELTLEEIGHGYWTHGSDVDALVSNLLPAHSVTEVLVDGVVVPPEFYDLYADEEGHLIIIFHPDYLDTLSISNHIISVQTEDGALHTIYILTILDPNSKPPYTGDNSNLTLWLGLALVSFTLLLVLILAKKRKGGDTHEE